MFLFCPNCSASLVTTNTLQVGLLCPSCGFLIGTEQRIQLTTSLPIELDFSTRLADHSNALWIWGTQREKIQLLRFNLTKTEIQVMFPSPNNWRVGGLSFAEKVLIFAPQEFNSQGDSKALMGIHLYTGKVLWKYSASGFMFTAPAADENIACAIDSNGTLVAVRPTSGKAVWKTFPQLGDFPYRGIPPVLSQEHVLAVQPESRGAGLLAFQRITGDLAWEFHPPEIAKVDFAPIVWNESAFVLAGEWLYRVFLKDGTWSRLSKSERKSSQGWYFAPPVVDEERVYLLEADYSEGKPAYALHAHDASTGGSLWKMKLNRRPYQPPALHGEYIYFVDRDGELYCLNKQDGQIIWQESLGAEPADAPVANQDSVVVLTNDAVLHNVKFSSSVPDISKPPDFYEKRGEWALAAGAYLINNKPFEAGLALLKVNDYRQANLSFKLVDNAERKVRELRQSFLVKKNDAQAGELAEDWGMVLIEQLGAQAQGNSEIATWFEQAAESFMLANQSLDAVNCRERAAQVMETPRIKLEVIAEQEARWVINEPVLLQVKVTNIGYGPARRVTVNVQGNIKKPNPTQSFFDLAIDQVQKWDNVRIIPNSFGAGLLEFVLDYESYRTKQIIQTKFTHPIQVGKNQAETILRALHRGAPLHIEKFFSPGATNNQIEVSDSQGIAIGDQAQSVLASSEMDDPLTTKENQMDPVTLVVSALVGGLMAGLTDTAKAAIKDMYDALKSRLVKKTDKNEDIQDALDKVEKQPDSKARQELLKEELGKLELDKDDELLKLAQSLLDALKESSGKYNVDIQNSQGVVVGDHATVNQNFEGSTRKKKKTNK